MQHLIRFVEVANENGFPHSLAPPRVPHPRASAMRTRLRMLRHTQGHLRQFLRNLESWMAMYHDAHPTIGMELVGGMTLNDANMLNRGVVPSEDDMQCRDVGRLYEPPPNARVYAIDEDDDLFQLRRHATFWMDAEVNGLSGQCAHADFARWRNELTIHAGDWSSFFAVVPKDAMDKQTFLRCSGPPCAADYALDTFSCVGDAIVSVLRLGQLWYNFPDRVFQVAHSDTRADVQAQRQGLHPGFDVDEAGRAADRHMLALTEMLSDDASFAQLVVGTAAPARICEIFYAHGNGIEEEIAFESEDAFVFALFHTQ